MSTQYNNTFTAVEDLVTDSNAPINYISQRAYKGINKIILSADEFTDKRYLTAKQVMKLGGKIIEGSTPTKIYYYKLQEKQVDDEIITIPVTKYYHIYNISQTIGILNDNARGGMQTPLTNYSGEITDKQKYLLRKLISEKYQYNDDVRNVELARIETLSKQEASIEIKELIDK